MTRIGIIGQTVVDGVYDHQDVEEAMKTTKTNHSASRLCRATRMAPTLMLNILNATEVAKAASGVTGCLVAPVMPMYSGEVSLERSTLPQTISAVINDICISLAQQGFENIVVLLNGGSESIRGIRDGLDISLVRINHLQKRKSH